MKKLVEYDGEELPVTMYWNIEEFLSPGTYRVDIFADGNLIGRKSFTLENSNGNRCPFCATTCRPSGSPRL